ncbi:MAG: phosphatidylserine decarboxylase family protein [Candidatus Aureabacteria bacterium]|nr:phosphatidylserine decarboxylase family protein [Candidatus Auribacterota bacterium]
MHQRYNIAREGMIFVFSIIICYIIAFSLQLLELSIIILVILLFVSFFFREPERNVAFPGMSIIAPGQGKVVRIDKRVEEEFLKKEMQCISIFLSVFDVHVTYTPFDSTVEDVIYKEGKFHNAMLDKSSLENEHATVLLSTSNGNIVVRQIAGMIARRVVCNAKKGDKLKKGKRYGIIKFGSRIDIFLPLETKIKVKINDIVIAGLTEIANFSE